MALKTWGILLADQRYTLSADNITAGGYTWNAVAIPYFEFHDLDDPASASVRLELRPTPAELKLLAQLNRLVGNTSELWRLEDVSGVLLATRVWIGNILRASIGKQDNLVLECGPSLTAFAATVPRQFGPLCRYISSTECSFAATCAKTWAACTANGQTAIFGGFRWIPPAGTRIVIRETMETIP